MEFTDLSVSLEWQELNTYIELRLINTISDPQDSLLRTKGEIIYIKK